MGELGEVVRQQKLRMRGLAQEKAEACARLQAMNPQVGQGCWWGVWWFLLLPLASAAACRAATGTLCC